MTDATTPTPRPTPLHVVLVIRWSVGEEGDVRLDEKVSHWFGN